ncbi:hypothetical protein O181_081434 [Austropuccinia psidii MF-1]|uniref:Prefoldin subunit 1 n=1 Tax=Austropuccinia psidii MF-1 TaxID=1389203 RepID=A0A9Q3IK46_9BASI|nr:hypothetical protein [Austropuccinia psidii MF-1]
MSNEQPNEEIRNILSQLQKQARDISRELSKNRVEFGSKVREARQCTLTLSELSRLSSDDIKFYRPVGKMFMLENRSSIEDRIVKKHKLAQEDSKKLTTKIKSLEAEVETNQRALKELVRSIDLESV